MDKNKTESSLHEMDLTQKEYSEIKEDTFASLEEEISALHDSVSEQKNKESTAYEEMKLVAKNIVLGHKNRDRNAGIYRRASFIDASLFPEHQEKLDKFDLDRNNEIATLTQEINAKKERLNNVIAKFEEAKSSAVPKLSPEKISKIEDQIKLIGEEIAANETEKASLQQNKVKDKNELATKYWDIAKRTKETLDNIEDYAVTEALSLYKHKFPNIKVDKPALIKEVKDQVSLEMKTAFSKEIIEKEKQEYETLAGVLKKCQQEFEDLQESIIADLSKVLDLTKGENVALSPSVSKDLTEDPTHKGKKFEQVIDLHMNTWLNKEANNKVAADAYNRYVEIQKKFFDIIHDIASNRISDFRNKHEQNSLGLADDEVVLSNVIYSSKAIGNRNRDHYIDEDRKASEQLGDKFLELNTKANLLQQSIIDYHNKMRNQLVPKYISLLRVIPKEKTEEYDKYFYQKGLSTERSI